MGWAEHLWEGGRLSTLGELGTQGGVWRGGSVGKSTDSLSEDPGLVPSTPTWWLTVQFQGALMLSSGLCSHTHGTQTYTRAEHTHKINNSENGLFKMASSVFFLLSA